MSASKLVFEIGTEEIPAMPLYAATRDLAAAAETALDEARLAHGEIVTYSTPRRMILVVEDLADASEALSMCAKGPAAAIAFDDAGNPTKAAEGFARGKGVDVSRLVRETDESGKEYVYAQVEEPSRKTADLLPELLANLVGGIGWPKSQRWGSGHVTFSRPIRWLMALYGEDVIPVEYAGLVAGRISRGNRLMADREFEFASAADLPGAYEEMRVIPSAKKRAQAIRGQINAIEAETGLKADTPKGTFDEVVNLVEYPTVLLAHFDERFLDVPPEIITDAMLEHQRYFPMYQPDGTLDNAFLVVSNGDPAYAETIVAGNERVVRARLDDAAFFVVEDRRKPLEGYVEGLKRVVFQERLGSVYDKTMRIVKCAEAVCDAAGITGTQRDDILRTALLCKADLITSAVVEFTSLQGIMGGHYARFSGETPEVALGITDHYRPRFADDDLSRNLAGTVTAFSDKLDTICGIFAIGAGPTGSSDPFALRRAAIGIVNILLSGLDVSLSELIDVALGNYRDVVDFDFDAVRDQVRAFFATRLEVIARDRGYAPDCIAAVMATGMFEPAETIARIDALQTARDEQPDTFENLATAYTRAANLADVALGCEADEALMGTQERALADAIAVAQESVGQALAAGAHADAIEALAGLRAPIDSFFDGVLIMDDDLALREMRLRLLNSFVDVFANVADIGKMAKK